MANHVFQPDVLTSIQNNTEITWVIDYVCDEDSFNEHRIDAHTHGLTDICGYEIQTTLRSPVKINGYILNTIGMLLSRNVPFNPGDYVYGLFQNPLMPVKLDENFDWDNTTILRILIPDPHGNFGSKAEYPYNTQSDNPYKN